MYSIMLDLFWTIAILNLLLLGILIIFFINARMNLYRQISERKYFLNIIDAAKTAESSAVAAMKLNMPVDTFTAYCKERGIDTPEIRREKKELIEKKRLDAERKIMEEEVLWRAEEEKRNEEQRIAKEEDARKRKDRLKKFGFK
jgi:hypothetical protein